MVRLCNPQVEARGRASPGAGDGAATDPYPGVLLRGFRTRNVMRSCAAWWCRNDRADPARRGHRRPGLDRAVCYLSGGC